MRSTALTVLAVLAGGSGCNQILGIADPPGACAAGCACSSDGECGLNEFCDDRQTSTMCDCAAGFHRTAGGCEWEGIVADPGFTLGTPWTAVNDAVVDVSATTPDLKDRGVARLGAGPCSAVVTQPVVMPRYSSQLTPLVAEVTYRMAGHVAPMFGIGTAWSTLPDAAPGSWNTARICLGSGQYGAAKSRGAGEPLTIAVRRTVDAACQLGGPAVDVDRFEIVPANLGECPLPGEVLNGAAEGPGGWHFTPAASTASVAAGFVAGVGVGASTGVQLHVTQVCDAATAAVAMSPSGVDGTGSPSLSLSASMAFVGTLGAVAAIGRSTIPIPATPALSPVRVCVPAPQRGAGGLFRAAVSNSPCVDTFNTTANLDEVTLTQDRRCGSDPFIADPGFESGYPVLDSVSPDALSTIQSIVPADGPAYSGTRVLEMRANSCAALTTVRFHVVTPSPASSAGPAMTLWLRSANVTNSVLSVSNFQAATTPTLHSGWTAVQLCLDPRLAGRGQDVSLSLQPLSCANSLPAVVQIDDLSVEDSGACPTG